MPHYALFACFMLFVPFSGPFVDQFDLELIFYLLPCLVTLHPSKCPWAKIKEASIWRRGGKRTEMIKSKLYFASLSLTRLTQWLPHNRSFKTLNERIDPTSKIFLQLLQSLADNGGKVVKSSARCHVSPQKAWFAPALGLLLLYVLVWRMMRWLDLQKQTVSFVDCAIDIFKMSSLEIGSGRGYFSVSSTGLWHCTD